MVILTTMIFIIVNNITVIVNNITVNNIDLHI